MSDNTTQPNPYLDARREWNERYGSYIAQARNWRFVAVISAMTALAAVGGVVYIGAQSKIIPYIVEVDKHGEAKYGGAVQTYSVDENTLKFSLAQFITNLRSIYPDNTIQKDYIFKVYNHLSSSFPANRLVDEFYKANPPFGLKFSQKVAIQNVTHIKDTQWQLDWTESRFGENGGLIDAQSFRAVIDVQINPPTTDEVALKNPLGLYIKDLTISKIIK